MKVLTKALIKKSEENAVRNGIFSFRELMLRAGTAAADIICKEYDCKDKKISVLCGTGNNGGDGFVIADALSHTGADVTVVSPFGSPNTEDAAYYRSALKNIPVLDSIDTDCDIIIDALFGIGLNRPLSEDAAALIEKINAADAVRISVDVPSGVSSDDGKILGSAVNADLTVTFIALKPCFLLPEGSDLCGSVIVADIGVTPVAHSYLTIDKPVLKKRTHNSHKGTYGTALLFCGCYGMAGAAILSARAALRSGAGIVKCVIADGIYQAFTAAVPEAVCVPVMQNSLGTLSLGAVNTDLVTDKCSAVLFGCGAGNNPDIYELLCRLLDTITVPVVIDADGINALCSGIDIIKSSKAPVILTPHPGEMARLCSVTVSEIEHNRIDYASDFAKKYGCILVLKGANTIIAEPSGEIFFNTNGNPGMSTGGSGDVLSGIIVSLLAQGLTPGNAAKAAVYLHGEAGDKAARKRGERAMLPSDMIEEL